MTKVVLIISMFLLAASAFAAEPTSFSVVVKGSGRPMILIPGLSSPGSVWDSTVAHYSDRYQTHTLTLAGFAGSKPIAAPFLPTVRAELADYIRTNKLEKPVLIGHSLGGFLSFWLASTEPHLVGKVVSVDGLPALGAMMNPDVTPEQLAQQADGMHMMLAAQSAEQFAAQTKLSMAGMITRPEENESIITAAVKSDPAAVAQAVKELMATDLRKEVKKIKSPVLLMAASAGMPEAYASTVKDRYEAQIAAIPNHEVVVAAGARHFIMLDDPQFFFATLDKFLATAKSERKLVEKTR